MNKTVFDLNKETLFFSISTFVSLKKRLKNVLNFFANFWVTANIVYSKILLPVNPLIIHI